MVPPSLSLIWLGSTEDPAERRVVEELLLAGVVVRAEAAPPGFAEWTLSQQLEAVRPQLGPTVAAAWIEQDSGALHLQVAFVESERAVVRVVDAAPGDEARLALTARELL
ncbi:MAG: hypothetical protein ABMA64_40720, partial [Myxococcota bacterium]